LGIKYKFAIGRQASYPSDELKMNLGEKLVWILFEVSSTTALFIALAYWGLIYDGTVDAGVVSENGLNVVFVIVEVLLNKLDLLPSHCIFPLLAVFLYMIFSWVWYSASGVWIYFFLNWSDFTASISYLMLLIMVVIFFFIMKGFTYARNRLILMYKRRLDSLSFQELKQWEEKIGGFDINEEDD